MSGTAHGAEMPELNPLARMGTDAAEWAKDFSLRTGIFDPTPGELLHGWFANAIEAGRTAGMEQEAKTGAYRAGLMAAGIDIRADQAGPPEDLP